MFSFSSTSLPVIPFKNLSFIKIVDLKVDNDIIFYNIGVKWGWGAW